MHAPQPGHSQRVPVRSRLIAADRKRRRELGAPPPWRAESKETSMATALEYIDRMNPWLDSFLTCPSDTKLEELEEMYRDELTKEIRLLMKELKNANTLIGVDIRWGCARAFKRTRTQPFYAQRSQGACMWRVL